MMSSDKVQAHDAKIKAGEDKQQAQAEQKLAEMSDDPTWQDNAAAAAREADKRAANESS